ncbi:MAG: SRPBCC domain-containing protein [Rhodobacter sp.]|jgi:hypothetical protein|nr:SRPBCC domain-containing protein [Rhodobacter sp.]
MPDEFAPITKSITVPLTPGRAFDLFTRDIADWWPLDSHSLSARDGAPAKSVSIPPQTGGEIVETMPDGGTAIWGRVTDWQPGRSFGMTWHVGRPADQASHVRVTFDVVADGTRVTLIHDNWQALGAQASAIRAGYVSGWDMVFATRYGDACRAALADAQ